MKDRDFQRLTEAIQRIYSAPDGDPFDAYGISAIASLFSASSGLLFTLPKGHNQGQLLAVCNISTLTACGLMQDISTAMRDMGTHLLWPVDKAIAINGIHPNPAQLPPDPLLELLDLDNQEPLLLGVIDETPDASYFACLLRDAAASSFSAADCERIRSLLPHWRRALEMRRRLARLRADVERTKAILDQAPFAIMLSESDGRVIYSNLGANQLCGMDDGIGLIGSRLRLSRAQDRDALAEALKAIGDPKSPTYGEQRILPVRRRSGKADFQLALMPISITGHDSDYEPNRYIQIFIYDPAHREPLHGEALQSLHGLTDAETRVCELLYSNISLAEISSHLSISVNTVKTHLARIFRKIGINSQRQLMQYLAQSPKVGAQIITDSDTKITPQTSGVEREV